MTDTLAKIFNITSGYKPLLAYSFTYLCLSSSFSMMVIPMLKLFNPNAFDGEIRVIQFSACYLLMPPKGK